MQRKHIVSTASLLLAAGLCNAQNLLTTQVIPGPYSSPTFLTHAPGDGSRLFIVQRGATNSAPIDIFDVASNAKLPVPFITVPNVLPGGERGLLGMDFHPDYSTNGHFYVNYTASGDGRTVIARFTRDPGNPNLADPATFVQVLQIAQPFSNHNAGWLGFGPDDFLYIPMGDGGSANDPGNRSQTLTQLLGKTLRIDINGDDFPTDPLKNYAIPPSNPFVGSTSTLPEIWHIGLRNPWRCSFDRQTGDMWLADVGQNAWEEINRQPASSVGGENYGWRCMEGNVCTGLTGCTCNGPTLTLPTHVYSHSQGCSITGGYVYRGCAIPQIQGQYFFADFCSNTIWSLVLSPQGTVIAVNNWTSQLGGINSISSFGEDADGELYIVSLGGVIRKIVPTAAPAPCCLADCDNNGTLNVFDYVCFGQAFSAQQPYGDCDNNGAWNVFDYICYGNLFAAGCP